MIYKMILPYKFVEIMTRDENGFSYEGASLMYDYYISLDTPIEFDPIGIRCEWTEYPTPFDAMHDILGIQYLENERLEYYRLRSEGASKGEALEGALGLAVLWDKKNPDSYVVGC